LIHQATIPDILAAAMTTYGSVGSGIFNTGAVVNAIFNAAKALSCFSLVKKAFFARVILDIGAAI
jgi:hypothetical protein